MATIAARTYSIFLLTVGYCDYVIIFFYHIVSVGDCGGGCGRGQGREEPLAVLHPREAVVALRLEVGCCQK